MQSLSAFFAAIYPLDQSHKANNQSSAEQQTKLKTEQMLLGGNALQFH